jgi:FdhD protein
MEVGTVQREWYAYRRTWELVVSDVIEEAVITINVNTEEFVTIMCSPLEQDRLALGFLRNEGLIEGMADVDHVHISEDGCCVDVWLKRPFDPPKRQIITSGCGGGVTFENTPNGFEPIRTDLNLSPEQLFLGFKKLHVPGSLHARARGVHTAGLTDGETIVAMAEDVGRHNAVDKLTGACMLEGIETRGLALLTTGRVSSEMLRKGAMMGCPIIASRTSPTSRSIAMAEAWGVTLAGYVRRGSMRVYTGPERLGFSQAS